MPPKAEEYCEEDQGWYPGLQFVAYQSGLLHVVPDDPGDLTADRGHTTSGRAKTLTARRDSVDESWTVTNIADGVTFGPWDAPFSPPAYRKPEDVAAAVVAPEPVQAADPPARADPHDERP